MFRFNLFTDFFFAITEIATHNAWKSFWTSLAIFADGTISFHDIEWPWNYAEPELDFRWFHYTDPHEYEHTCAGCGKTYYGDTCPDCNEI